MMLQDNETRAVLKRIRVSPQKLNLVAAMIRGLHAKRAMDILLFSKKRIAIDVRKTLQSAIANAQNNKGLDPDSLYVKESFVGSSIKLRRFSPRGRGRSGSIVKPFSHLTIVVEERKV